MTVITLIGYRATGKSTLGPLVAQSLNFEFIDADTELEQRTKRTIPEIFATDGEPGFRKLEAYILRDLLSRNKLVLASGGGAILDPNTCQLMRAAGPVVWLKADSQTIASRLSKDEDSGHTRPSLTGADVRDEIIDVMKIREPLYQQTATIEVDTNLRDTNAIVPEILNSLPSDIVKNKGFQG